MCPQGLPIRLSKRWAWGILAVVVVGGLLLRLARYSDSVLGDELSTLFATDRSLGATLSFVAGDGEISPPLYFVLAWLSGQLGSGAELVRLPALIAGVGAIPLTYAVGARTVGRGAGLIAATVMALSPFMIFYSTDGRAYTLAIALLLGSTLAMLAAVEGGGRRWWVLYAALSCLAMYSHYTSAFVLVAQLLWLAWAYPRALRAALVANLGAALLFFPWLPSAIADSNSPTIEILEALQGSGLEIKLRAIATWAFGYPFAELGQLPGRFALLLSVGGLAVAAVAALVRLRRRKGPLWRPPEGVVLVLAIGIAAPLAEVSLLLLGVTDLLGARNLNISSGGLALSIGTVLAAAGPLVGGICILAVIAGFGIGASRTLDPDRSEIAFNDAAEFVNEEARPGDVVVDAVSALVTPVPLTPIDIYLTERDADFTPFLPVGEPPFLPFQAIPPPADEQLEAAFEQADGGRVVIIAKDDAFSPGMVTLTGLVRPAQENPAPGEDIPREPPTRVQLPEGARYVGGESYPGIVPIEVAVIDLAG